MPLINLSIKHGRTIEDARARLEMTVHEVRARFGAMVQRVEWSADHDSVRMFGPGFEIEIRVDAQDVHAAVDVPILGGLLKNPLVSGLKAVLQQTFQKRLK